MSIVTIETLPPPGERFDPTSLLSLPNDILKQRVPFVGRLVYANLDDAKDVATYAAASRARAALERRAGATVVGLYGKQRVDHPGVVARAHRNRLSTQPA